MSIRNSLLGGIHWVLLLAAVVPGCSYHRFAVPAHCVTDMQPVVSKSDMEPINFIRLRQDPPEVYLLGAGDVLGIYIEGVTGSSETPPPVHFPDKGNLPPAIGYPIPIREDGTLSLPLISPIDVEGLTLAQAEDRIRRAYTVESQILLPERDQIIVTLMRPRTYHVLVIREDTGANPHIRNLEELMTLGATKRGQTHALDLPAYENDVLHALSESGGLPGVDAKNEVTILRGAFDDASKQAEIQRMLNDPEMREAILENPNVLKIPLRVSPGEVGGELRQEDIILGDGDVVLIESRETEVFYTGGLLPGGQHPLPRDYDIDVMGAMAMAGGSIGTGGGAGGNRTAFSGGNRGLGGIIPPTRVIVLRTINGQQVPIEISLKRAILDPAERIIIQPGDFILLEYTEAELAANVLLSTFQLNYFLNNIR